MKEIIVRIYDTRDKGVSDALCEGLPINYFDVSVDGEIFTDLKSVTLKVSRREDGEGNLVKDPWSTIVQLTAEKDYSGAVRHNGNCWPQAH